MKRLYIIYILVATVLFSFASCNESPEYSVEGGDRILSVSPEIINAYAYDYTYYLSIDTQYPYEVTSDSNWIVWNSGMHNIEIDDNPSFEERVGYVTVTVRDNEFDVEYSKKVKVTQAGQEPYLSVTSSSFVDDNYMEFTKYEGTQTIVINTNMSWNTDLFCISGEDGSTSDDWISISPRRELVPNPAEPYWGWVEIKVLPNDTGFTRSATLTIWAMENESTFWGNPHSTAITIFQDVN